MAHEEGVLPLGHSFPIWPIPASVEHTEFFDAGSIVIGVEARHLSNVAIEDFYRDDPRSREIFMEVRGDDAADDSGVSIHVMSSDRQREFVRFDMFDNDPHYHYLFDDGSSVSITYDTNANGAVFDWVLRCLEGQLPQMLRYAGGGAPADDLDTERVAEILPLIVRARERGLAQLEAR